MLLFVSMENDYHIDFLIERIMDDVKKSKIVIFKTESFPMSSRLVLKPNLEDSYIKLNRSKVSLSNISAVWYRRPAKPVIDSFAITKEDMRDYAQQECKYALLDVWEAMDNCLWVSKPSIIRNASHKLEQLIRAKRIGFEVPHTLITNDPNHAREFCREMGDAIVKAVRCSVFARSNGEYEMAYSSPIHYDDPRIEDVVFSPCIFQKYIPKQLELRITVVDNQVFACAIYSQASEKTKHDWRNYDFENTPHKSWTLPLNIEKKCRSFVHSYGLRFGAIDMILTPEGQYVFLELNPNGQWAWIENLTRMPISRALIDLLFSRE